MTKRIAILIGTWIVGVTAIGIMRKIEPENKMYPVWVLFMEFVLTLLTVAALV